MDIANSKEYNGENLNIVKGALWRIINPLANALTRISNQVILNAAGIDGTSDYDGYLGFTSVPNLKYGLDVVREHMRSLGITSDQVMLGMDMDGILVDYGFLLRQERMDLLTQSEFSNNLIGQTNRRRKSKLNQIAGLRISKAGNRLVTTTNPLNNWLIENGLAERTFWQIDQQNKDHIPRYRDPAQWKAMIDFIADVQPRLLVDFSDQGSPLSFMQDWGHWGTSQAHLPLMIQGELAARGIQPPVALNVAINPFINKIITAKALPPENPRRFEVTSRDL